MASERQVAANRANSKRSSGPRSTEGRRRVALNSVKHGLFSRALLVTGGCEAELLDLKKQIHARYQPDGDVEKLYIDLVVSCMWRMRRLLTAENKGLCEDDQTTTAAPLPEDTYTTFSRCEAGIRRTLQMALREFRLLKAERPEENETPGEVVRVIRGR